MTNAQYAIKLTLEGASGAGSALRGLWSGFSAGGRAISAVNSQLFYFGSNIAGVFRTAQGFTRTTLSLVDALVGPNMRFETASLQFEQLLGSADAAKERIAELYKFAASTPFESPDVLAAGKALQMFGGAALGTGDGLKMVGDMAALAQRPMADVANLVGRAYSQIKSGEGLLEVGKSLEHMGLYGPAAQAALEPLIEAKADPSVIWAKFVEVMGFAKGSAERLGNSLEGVFSTLKDMYGEFKRFTGHGLFEALKTDMTKLRDDLTEAFDDGRMQRWANTASNAIRELYTNIKDKSIFGLTANDIMTSADAGKLGATLSAAMQATATNFWGFFMEGARKNGPELLQSLFGEDSKLSKWLGVDETVAQQKLARGDPMTEELWNQIGYKKRSEMRITMNRATRKDGWGVETGSVLDGMFMGSSLEETRNLNPAAFDAMVSQLYGSADKSSFQPVSISDVMQQRGLGRFSGMSPAAAARMGEFYRFNFGSYAEGYDRSDIFNPFGAARAAGAIGRGFIGDMADTSSFAESTNADNIRTQLDELNAKLGDTVRLQTDLVRELIANIQRARGTF